MKYFKGISITVILLGFVSFLNDASSEMIRPILPMFITALGGAGIAVGLIGGLSDSISSILNVISGYISDKKGKRKIFVSSGYIISAIFKLLLSFSKFWYHILLFTGFERVGKGLRTPARDAMIADAMPKERGKGFGIHRALDTSGAILGAFFVFILFWFFNFSFTSIIFISAILAFLSLTPIYFVKEEKRETKPKIFYSLSAIKKLPIPLKLFILIAGIFSLANFSYMFFILKAQGAFAGKLSIGIPLILYILFNIFYAIFAIPFGTLSDKLGRRKVLVFGYFLFSLTALSFALFNSFTAFLILFAFYGIVYAIVDGNQRAYISDLSNEELRATALGTFHTAIGLTALPSSLIAGFLWQNISPNTTFIYGSIISIISVFLFILLGSYFKAQRDVNI
ncbi:MAG: MFS transporter [Candidatus Thermoplasmatota archaeon]